MSTTNELTGKVALVTGASANLGREIALTLARGGADVVIHYNSDSSRPKAESVAAEIAELSGGKQRTLLVQADLGNVASIRRIFAEIIEKLGGIDIVVNNHGVYIRKPFVDVTEEDFDTSFNTNTKSTFFIMQESAKHMRDNGRIVSISSTLTILMNPMTALYTGAKAPLEHFAKSLAKEIGHRGITVNTVAPGPIDTPFFYQDKTQAQVDAFKAMVPLKRLADVSEIAELVAFVASEKARWINGQIIYANGGLATR
ncbi:short chain dehydrogenase [Ramicandelaber brevisporus]|nr:short chain dehydrogenase [Ramicandelaber brevisporus]